MKATIAARVSVVLVDVAGLVEATCVLEVLPDTEKVILYLNFLYNLFDFSIL